MGVASKKIQTTKQRLLQRISVNPARRHNEKRTFQKFAEKIGFVYFGYVDQRDDEHQLVRGITLSPTHRDHHYCIGSHKGYDMILLERVDTVTFPGKPTRPYHWTVLQIDLRSASDLPHTFVGINTHSDTFYANFSVTFSRLKRAYIGMLGVHDASFTNRYSVYVEPARSIDAERMLNTTITKMIGDHFYPLDIEIIDSILYVYADKQTVSTQLLDSMFRLGIWLAESLDKTAQDA